MTNRADRIDHDEPYHINAIIDTLPQEAQKLVGGIPLWDCNGDLLGVVRREDDTWTLFPNRM